MLGKWGLQAASRGHFSGRGCIALTRTSQTADGQGISCVPPSVIRYNIVYRTAEDKPNGYGSNRVQGALVLCPSAALRSSSN